jgi:AP-4 complex subunit mu-1
VFKDYCGVLSEETIRTNFILVYELLDEVIDFGYVQGTSTELLKAYVHNEPVVVEQKKGFKLPDINSSTTPSTAVDKPIMARDRKGKNRKNEIFVDIFEKINITFNSSGYVMNSSIDGTIQMKSYLAGNPSLRLALNEELVVGKGTGGGNFGAVEIDDCNFHECVNTETFESEKTLTFLPPDGEFTVMNYRITSDFRTPFRIFPFFELVSPHKIELIIKIRADIPETNYGANVVVTIPVPKATSSVTSELGTGVVGQATEYDQKERKTVWKIKKFAGGTEQTLRCRITLDSAHTTAVRKEVGPISMNFEVPMFNPSNLQVRYLRIQENTGYNPYRWVRYVTRSSSYVCRV